MNPKCVQKLDAAAKLVGAVIEFDEYYLTADAPCGYVWIANGGASLSEPCSNGSQTWAAQACRELAERMRMGLVLADDDEREEIEWDRDESWSAAAGSPERLAVAV